MTRSPMPAEHHLSLRVRYVECDPMGLLHHSQYLVYFEMGRTELLRSAGLNYRDLEQAGFFFVVAKLEVRFKLPARYDDELVLTTRVARLTRARIDHQYSIARDRSVLTEATSTIACVDRQGQLIAVPELLIGAE